MNLGVLAVALDKRERERESLLIDDRRSPPQSNWRITMKRLSRRLAGGIAVVGLGILGPVTGIPGIPMSIASAGYCEDLADSASELGVPVPDVAEIYVACLLG